VVRVVKLPTIHLMSFPGVGRRLDGGPVGGSGPMKNIALASSDGSLWHYEDPVGLLIQKPFGSATILGKVISKGPPTPSGLPAYRAVFEDGEEALLSAAEVQRGRTCGPERWGGWAQGNSASLSAGPAAVAPGARPAAAVHLQTSGVPGTAVSSAGSVGFLGAIVSDGCLTSALRAPRCDPPLYWGGRPFSSGPMPPRSSSCGAPGLLFERRRHSYGASSLWFSTAGCCCRLLTVVAAAAVVPALLMAAVAWLAGYPFAFPFTLPLSEPAPSPAALPSDSAWPWEQHWLEQPSLGGFPSTTTLFNEGSTCSSFSGVAASSAIVDYPSWWDAGVDEARAPGVESQWAWDAPLELSEVVRRYTSKLPDAAPAYAFQAAFSLVTPAEVPVNGQ